MEKKLWSHVQTVRETSPLVHNITNFVVMNNTANAVLAVGASPIMAHAHPEINDMVGICHSLVINIGTLDEYWVSSMLQAAQQARTLAKPWLLDPVGAGATPFRNEVNAQLLALSPTVIRANASEILALARANTTKTKGVDSTAESTDALKAAKSLVSDYGCVVCISGKTDIVVGPQDTWFINNGNAMMTSVTGLGCSASAVTGAFLGAGIPAEEALLAAMALFSICGELAALNSAGPGSLQLNLTDKLYNITETEFLKTVRINQ